MIACAADGTSGSSSVSGFFQRIAQGVKKLLVPLYGAGDVNLITGIRRPLPILPSRRHSLRLTRITPNRLWWPTTTHEAATPAPSISPAHRSPPTVAPLSPPHHRRTVKAPSPIRRAILLFCTTSQARPGLPCGWTTACGGQGLGGYKSTTPSDPTSWTHFCVHQRRRNDDRESGWADNNPSSPFFGRMYISWNDFSIGGGASSSRCSTDNGVTWQCAQLPVAPDLHPQRADHRRQGHGRRVHRRHGRECRLVGLTNRANKIYRSTDGGNTWTNTYTGPTFPGPGRSTSGFFCHHVQQPRLLAAHGLG